MKQIQPIQIIGTQRSGSNLLRLILNQFKEISAPHPPHILQRFIPLLPLYGNLNDSHNFTRLINDVCTLVELNPVTWTGLHLDRKEISRLCKSHNLISIFQTIYNLKAKQDKAIYWACKSMANINYSNDIEKAGLHPLYIHMYRDGRDVACSFKKTIVGEKHVYSIANQWVKNQEACIALKNKIPQERFIRISYEELVHSPETEMKRLSLFLNINYNPSVFDFYKSEDSKKTATAGRMWENVSKPILKNNTNKYKRELSEMEIAIFEKQAGTTLSQLNYTLEASDIINGKPFSREQIIAFEQRNNELKKQARESADPSGAKNREKQEQFLNNLKSLL